MYAIGGVNSYRWYDQLQSYVKSAQVFVCPNTGRKWDFGAGGRNATYGYNYQYLGNTRANCSNVPVTESRIETPANTIAVADTSGTGTRSCQNQSPSDAEFDTLNCRFNHGYSIDPPILPRCVSGGDPTCRAPAVCGPGSTRGTVAARTSPSWMGMRSGCEWRRSTGTTAGGTGVTPIRIRRDRAAVGGEFPARERPIGCHPGPVTNQGDSLSGAPGKRAWLRTELPRLTSGATFLHPANNPGWSSREIG